MRPQRAMEYVVMADERPAEEAADRQPGVFGKLPSSRPGVRSPRRGTEGAEQGRPGAYPAADRPAPGPEPEAAPPPPRRSSPPPRQEPKAPESGSAPSAGVEDLAWAGITVAAEAATLGVRLLSRAVEAVRKPSDPR